MIERKKYYLYGPTEPMPEGAIVNWEVRQVAIFGNPFTVGYLVEVKE